MNAVSIDIRAGGDGAGRSAPDFSAELVTLMPRLRGFARTLTGDRESAEDLAQEALAKAWRFRHAYQPGTNLKAWLFTIARNQFFTNRRRAQREGSYDQAEAENIPSNGAEQIPATELADTMRALQTLPDGLRQALLLVGVGGCSYAEAAEICGCPVGTAKSRVSRARRILTAMLDGKVPDDDMSPPHPPASEPFAMAPPA